jgi:hypothetical protein
MKPKYLHRFELDSTYLSDLENTLVQDLIHQPLKKSNYSIFPILSIAASVLLFVWMKPQQEITSITSNNNQERVQFLEENFEANDDNISILSSVLESKPVVECEDQLIDELINNE